MRLLRLCRRRRISSLSWLPLFRYAPYRIVPMVCGPVPAGEQHRLGRPRSWLRMERLVRHEQGTASTRAETPSSELSHKRGGRSPERQR
jgi:hypothetical protein